MQGPSIDQLLDNAGRHLDARQFSEAESSVGIALMMDPRNLRAMCFKAIIAAETNRPRVALPIIEKTLKIAPMAPGVLNNAACVLARCGQTHRAIELWRRLLALVPNAAEAHYNIAINNMRVGESDAAEAGFRRVIELLPDHPHVYMNLADILKNSGRIEEAVDLIREGIRRQPGDMRQRSSLLYGMHFDPRSTRTDIYNACAAWGRDFEANVRPFESHPNDRSPDRPLRIGYVSPNFRDHSETYFVLPLFRGTDRARYQTWAYNCNIADDDVTPLIRARTDVWRDVSKLGEEEVANVIREDSIDVLVDLTMHMEGARLGVFARRPAPVQVTWLAYPSTTGMRRIDCSILDPFLNPPADTDSAGVYSERVHNLPHCYWCYEVYGPKPEVSPLPAAANGFVTFGSLNHYGKVTRDMLDVWATILNRVAESQLILHVGSKKAAAAAHAFFAERGIVRKRIECQLRVPRQIYMETYQRMDIALDPFPYNGATTTCDALFMGVPVVSRAGETAVSRAGLSILSNVGLSDLVATTREGYIEISANLAHDIGGLAGLRGSLRARLEQSKVMDAAAFGDAMTSAYRMAWKRWCHEPVPAGDPV